jgi:hypothetical protein
MDIIYNCVQNHEERIRTFRLSLAAHHSTPSFLSEAQETREHT